MLTSATLMLLALAASLTANLPRKPQTPAAGGAAKGSQDQAKPSAKASSSTGAQFRVRRRRTPRSATGRTAGYRSITATRRCASGKSARTAYSACSMGLRIFLQDRRTSKTQNWVPNWIGPLKPTTAPTRGRRESCGLSPLLSSPILKFAFWSLNTRVGCNLFASNQLGTSS